MFWYFCSLTPYNFFMYAIFDLILIPSCVWDNTITLTSTLIAQVDDPKLCPIPDSLLGFLSQGWQPKCSRVQDIKTALIKGDLEFCIKHIKGNSKDTKLDKHVIPRENLPIAIVFLYAGRVVIAEYFSKSCYSRLGIQTKWYFITRRTLKCSLITSALIVVAFQLRVSSSSSFSLSQRSSSVESWANSNRDSHWDNCWLDILC